MSGITPCQVLSGITLPCSKILSRQPNCQIRKNKLYYQIILFSPTEFGNLNSNTKSKPISHTVHQKSKIRSEMPHLNKSKKRQQRMNNRHPQAANQNAESNNLIYLSIPNSLTNQIFIAGPNQAAKEAFQLIPRTEFSFITAAQLELATTTGKPREATQQALTHRGIISAGILNISATEVPTQQLIDNSVDANVQTNESISLSSLMTATATGQVRTATQQVSTSCNNKSADHTGIHAQTETFPIINGLGEHRQDPIGNLVQLILATGQLWEATQ
jgi:hypothetical protein